MKCPACDNALKEVPAGSVKVDICEGGCGGIWFDADELQQMDDGDEPLQPALLRIAVDSSLKVDHDAPRDCPRCAGVVMMRHYYSVRHQVVVDQCAGCGGFWLDAGEYEAIRGQYESQAQREGEHDRDFAQVWAKVITEADAKYEQKMAPLRRVNDVLKHVRPSYYIRGK